MTIRIAIKVAFATGCRKRRLSALPMAKAMIESAMNRQGSKNLLMCRSLYGRRTGPLAVHQKMHGKRGRGQRKQGRENQAGGNGEPGAAELVQIHHDPDTGGDEEKREIAQHEVPARDDGSRGGTFMEC